MTNRRLRSRRDALEILSAWICDSEVCTRWLMVIEQPRHEPVEPTQERPPVQAP